jgi:hypothetical protein
MELNYWHSTECEKASFDEATQTWAVQVIREGKPVTLTSFEDGVRYMEFTDAVWWSWKEGRAVDVAGL